MKQYSDRELEKIIKEAVCEMVESTTPPTLEESWARFEKKLREKQLPIDKSQKSQRKNVLFLRLAFVAVIIISLAGLFTISFPLKARAIGEKIVSTVETLLSGTQMNISTEYKHNEPGRLPPPTEDYKEISIDQERVVSLEEVKSVSPFPVVIPHYLPDGYKLDYVKLQEMVKNTAIVRLRYADTDSNYFLISEMNALDGYVEGYGYDIEDTIVENIKIGESEGKIIIFKNGDIKINWIKQGILCELTGKIKKEEALKIVEAMD